MDFAVADYIQRSFEDVAADARLRAAGLFRLATQRVNDEMRHESAVLGEGPTGLEVEVGPLRLCSWGTAEAPVHWRSAHRPMVIDAMIRFLPVNGGTWTPTTEQLLQGSWMTEAAYRLRPVGWVRRATHTAFDLAFW